MEPGFGEGFGSLPSDFLLRVSSASLWSVDALYPHSLSQGKVETQIDADNYRVAVDDARKSGEITVSRGRARRARRPGA